MKNSFMISVAVFTIILTLTGCRQKGSRAPYQWSAAGSEFDSITRSLEDGFNNYIPFDSLASLIDKMDRLAEADKKNYNLKKSRSLYWQARFVDRLEDSDSAKRLLKKALALNDSARHRYDRLRMTSLYYDNNDSIDGKTRYRHLDECLTYSREIGDKGFEAQTAIRMGNLMRGVGEYEKALCYYSLSDSLHKILSYPKLIVKDQINVASTIGGKGDRETEDSILRSLMGHPYLLEDTFANNLLPRNLYNSTKDVAYLYTAYRQICNNNRFRKLRGLYAAELANHNFKERHFDSVIYYINIAQSDLPYVSDYGHKAYIWLNTSLGWIVNNQHDSALICRIRYELYLDSMRTKLHTSEVLELSALQEMEVMQAKYSAHILKRNMIWAFVTLTIICGAAITILVSNRRHIRQRMKLMATEIDLERSKRKMAVSALAIEEKDNMLGVLRDELSMLRKEGKIGEGNARHLESTIKAHLSEHESEETFRDMFDVVNPIFRTRLAELCPGLAESYVKIACYIMMDLDNKKIARIMMIKPESVRQARWRLSRKLNLPEGTSLEDFLRRLNNP